MDNYINGENHDQYSKQKMISGMENSYDYNPINSAPQAQNYQNNNQYLSSQHNQSDQNASKNQTKNNTNDQDEISNKNFYIDMYQWSLTNEALIPKEVIDTLEKFRQTNQLVSFKSGFSRSVNMAYFIINNLVYFWFFDDHQAKTGKDTDKGGNIFCKEYGDIVNHIEVVDMPNHLKSSLLSDYLVFIAETTQT